MSAYLVRPQQLGIMVSVFGASSAHAGNEDRDYFKNQIQDLAQANIGSMRAKYNPGQSDNDICLDWVGLSYQEYLTQGYEAFKNCYHDSDRWQKYTNPAQIIKYCRNYNYQSCEFEGWNDSEGNRVCNWVRNRAEDKLPGMDDMSWGYEDDAEFEKNIRSGISLYDLSKGE